MVLYTLWNGRKTFDTQLLNSIASYKNTQAITKLSYVDPKFLVDSFGRTLLHYAAASKNLDIIKNLLDSGCEINARDNMGSTPLIYAMHHLHLPTIQILLATNSDIFAENQHGENSLRLGFAHRGYLQNDIAAEFLNAVKRKYLSDCSTMAKILIEAKCSLPQSMILEDSKLTECMLSNGCKVNDRDFDGFTALHYAVQRGDLENVKLLVERGADVNARNRNLQMPLHLYNFRLSSKKKFEMLCFILDRGARLNNCDEDGFTVTMKFFRYGKLADVKILLKYDVDISKKYTNGTTLLHQAAKNENYGVIQLLKGRKFDVNVKDDNGDTPIWYAGENGNWAAFEFLLRNGADLMVKDEQGNTVLKKCFMEWSEMEYKLKNFLICAEMILQFKVSFEDLEKEMEEILDLLLEKKSFQLAKVVLGYLAVKKGRDQNFLFKLDSYRKLREYFSSCVDKIEKMKRTVVHHSVTLFKFLYENEEKLVLYARNKEMVARLEEILEVERHSDLCVVKVLKRKISRAVKTAKLKNRSAFGISMIKGLKCNWDVIDNIVAFLDYESLRRVGRLSYK